MNPYLKWAVIPSLFALLTLYAIGGCKDKPTVVAPPVVVSDEAPDSLRFCATLAPLDIVSAVGSPNRYWPQKKVLRIGFQKNPTAAQIEFFKTCVAEIDTLINLSVTYPAQGPYDQIWVFDPAQGSKSYVGTDCSYFASKGQVTGWIGWGWNGKNQSGTYTDGVARHEFLHAVGAQHEMCNANTTICWNKENVYSDLAKQGWSREMVDHNVFTVCDPAKHQQTQWDKFSVMMYQIPGRWTCENVAIPGGQFLTETDKAFWSGVYKNDNAPIPSVNVTITTKQRDYLRKLQNISRLYADSVTIYSKRIFGI